MKLQLPVHGGIFFVVDSGTTVFCVSYGVGYVRMSLISLDDFPRIALIPHLFFAQAIKLECTPLYKRSQLLHTFHLSIRKLSHQLNSAVRMVSYWGVVVSVWGGAACV